MNLFILIFLIWMPFAVLVKSIVNFTPGSIKNIYKRILLYIVTLPIFWIGILNSFVGKYWQSKWFSNLGRWFKK